MMRLLLLAASTVLAMAQGPCPFADIVLDAAGAVKSGYRH